MGTLVEGGVRKFFGKVFNKETWGWRQIQVIVSDAYLAKGSIKSWITYDGNG